MKQNESYKNLFIFGAFLSLGIFIGGLKAEAAVTISNFRVNGSVGAIATIGVTNLTFTATANTDYACDMNLFDENNTYIGPYKPANGSVGSGSSGGSLNFSGQNGVFRGFPPGGYYFELVCAGGGDYSNLNLTRPRVYVDFSPQPATINVVATSCVSGNPVASWNLNTGQSGSGASGSYSVFPGSYTLSASVPPGYNPNPPNISNGEGGQNVLNITSGQTKTFTISCNYIPDCPANSNTTLTCPSGSGTYTQTTTYGSAPSCTPTTSDNQQSACVSTGGGSTQCNPPSSVTKSCPSGYNSGSYTETTTYSGASCTPNTTNDMTSVCTPVTTSTPLPPCRVDSFPAQSESGGVVYPTWATSNSNNVVLSGGQYGSGIQVEPDGQRSMNISSNTLLTITANAGATTCSPTASLSAWMYAESVSMCTVPGKEYLQASDPNCRPEDPTCSFVDPYNGGDGFPDFSETGDGYTPIYWYSNAGSLTLSGGPYSNYSVSAPNSNGYFSFPNITTNTQVTLTGNGGQCSNSSWLYAAAVPQKPTPFTATAAACSSGTINLSWGEAPGSYNYVAYRDGVQIYSGPAWNASGGTVFADTGRTPGQNYSYSVIGQSPNGNTLPNTTSATAPVNCVVPPPANPTGFIVSQGSCGTGSANLSWNASSGATNYKVYRNSGSGPLLVYNNSGVSFTDTGLSSGTTYSYTITASNAGGTSSGVASTPASITGPISCTPTFNYSLSNSGTSNNQKGGITTYTTNTITKTITAGNTQAVDLSVTGLPSGVSIYGISNQTCSPSCQSVITFAVSPSASVGTFPITVTGSPLSKTTGFNLTIVSSPAILVTCSPSTPPTGGYKIGNSVTWTAAASGGSGNFTSYVWSGTGISTNPAPTSNPYSLSYSTVGTKTAQVTVTDSLGNSGTCPAVNIQVNFNPKIEEF